MKGGVLAVLTAGRVIRSVPILASGQSVTVQESWGRPGLPCTSGVPHRLAGGRVGPLVPLVSMSRGILGSKLWGLWQA